MKPSNQMQLVTGACVVLALAGVGVMLAGLVERNARHTEQAWLAGEAERAKTLLQAELQSLAQLTRSRADAPSGTELAAHLDADATLAALWPAAGPPVRGLLRGAAGTAMALPTEQWEPLRLELGLGGPLPPGTTRSAIARAGETVYLAAASPTAGGTLVLARAMGASELERLSLVLGHRLSLHPVAAARDLPDLAQALPDLLAGRPAHVDAVDGETAAASTLLLDGRGDPSLILRFTAPRLVMAQARQTTALAFGGLALLALICLFGLRRLFKRLGGAVDLAEEMQVLRSFVEQTAEGIVLLDRRRGSILRSNDAAQRLLAGLPPEQAARWLGEVLTQGTPSPGGDRLEVHDVRLRRDDGVELDLEVVCHPFAHGGDAVMCVCLRDVSERKLAEHRIRHQAYHDGLTQLPNRALFNDRLAVSLAQARRSLENVGVLLLDLDHFKTINDTLGHDLGDELLVQATERIRRCVRDGDTIARLGGDEFVVLLPRLEAHAHAGNVAERILNSLRAPFILGGREVHISCSIGVACYPKDGEDASTLFRNADMAMYHAKQQGRNAWVLHDASMNDQAADLLELKTELLHALRNDELFLEYQPQVHGGDGRLIGFEALVRWRSPKRGVVPPGRFIPVAEETGIIVAVGEWVLREACRQVRAWLDAGLPAVRVAVNFSARQFLERDLVERVRRALEDTGCPPELIEVEVTESIAMKHADRSVAALRAFRDLGMGVALDDFGTGYSSLAYLRQFPLERLKMDRAFIKEMTDTDNSRTMVDAIVSLAHSLDLEVCAEGVETPEQLQILRSLGCDLMQGFGLARPMPGADATELLTHESPYRWARLFPRVTGSLLAPVALSRVSTNVH